MNTIVPWLRLVVAAALVSAAPAAQAANARLFVLTDIGNEPDDQMSLVRLLLYSNEIDIEGLAATTSVWQREKVSPDLAEGVVAAFCEWAIADPHVIGIPAPVTSATLRNADPLIDKSATSAHNMTDPPSTAIVWPVT